MNMKLSYRDKVIFIIFISVIVLVLGSVFLIKPRVNELEVTKYNLQNKQEEKQRVDEKINTLDPLIETLKTNAKEIEEIQKHFYVESEPYQFEQMLTDKLSNLRLNVTKINTAYAEADDIEKYKVYPKNILSYQMKMDADLYDELPQDVYDNWNKVQAMPSSPVVIGTTKATIAFSSLNPYDDVMKALDILAADEQTLIVYTASAEAVTIAGEEAGGTLDITIYSIVPMNIEKIMESSAKIEIES